MIFEKTAEEQKKIDGFKQKLQNTINTLEPYSEQADITELKKAAKSFDRKIEDFYKDDRKLNIGVIGQVKAGKSTFLNTLLFDGKDVLPSARTPKTIIFMWNTMTVRNGRFWRITQNPTVPTMNMRLQGKL